MGISPDMRDYDLIIVGGGMVGLSLACALADTSLRLLVVDAGPEPASLQFSVPRRDAWCLHSGYEARVSALSNRSARFLGEIGAWQRVDSGRRCPYSNMVVWDAQGTAEIDFASSEEGPQGFIVENRLLQAALWEQARSQPNIEMIYECAVTEVNVIEPSVRLNSGQRVKAELIVGCDGSESRVAKYGGLRKREWSYNQQAVVAVVETERSHQMTAWQCFTSRGPLAFLPLDADSARYCTIVWSMKPRDAEDVMGLSDESFCNHLTRGIESRLGQVMGADRRFAFPLRQRHAVHYGSKRLLLAGDAAHTIHPLAGQGVNLGFADTRQLARLLKEIANVSKEQRNYGGLLRAYEQKRKPQNLAMMVLMESFKRLYSTHHPAVSWIRNAGVRLFQSSPGLKQQIIRVVGGL